MSTQIKPPQIAFIGAGNMAASIIGGLLEKGHSRDCIRASDPHAPTLEKLAKVSGVATSPDNVATIDAADVVILAVKPQVMAEVVTGISEAVSQSGAVVVSIAAGITIDAMQHRLGDTAPIIRCMPNTPALLGCGASALFANEHVSESQKKHAESILSAVGLSIWVEQEAQLDAITALSGSGPAYFFRFTEAMVAVGQELGLTEEVAAAMAKQTALGAARMAVESDVDLAELRRRVTSPGGTTQSALESFENSDLEATVRKAMQAAANRAVEMAKEMG